MHGPATLICEEIDRRAVSVIGLTGDNGASADVSISLARISSGGTIVVFKDLDGLAIMDRGLTVETAKGFLSGLTPFAANDGPFTAEMPVFGHKKSGAIVAAPVAALLVRRARLVIKDFGPSAGAPFFSLEEGSGPAVVRAI